MKYKDSFGSFYSVNFDVILHHQKQTQDFLDIIEKTFYAGFVAKYGRLLVFGAGSERGTFGEFVNLHLQGTDFRTFRDALTWFTNIYSTALRNKGSTQFKTNFYLSQQQEIFPLLDFFGIRNYFEQAWQEVKDHDTKNGLLEEIKEQGRIDQWQTRTKLITIPLITKEVEIMESVSGNMITPNNEKILKSNGITNPSDFLQFVFIEGTRGLNLSADDIISLTNGQSIVARYNKAA